MKKLTLIFLISLITLALLSQAIVTSYGKENNEQKNAEEEIKTEVKQNNGKTEIKVESKIESVESEEENENEIEDNDKGKNRIKFLEKKDNEFKIWGPIQSFTFSSITIDGKTITIDPNTLGKFKQVGVLNIGMYAKVEGKIINDTMYAEKIVVDNRNKVTSTPSVSPTITPTVSAFPTITETVTPTASITPTATGTPTVTPSETPTPTATETPTLEISSSDAFILDKMILNFQNLLRRLLRLSEE